MEVENVSQSRFVLQVGQMHSIIAVLVNFLFLSDLNFVRCQSGLMVGRVDAVVRSQTFSYFCRGNKIRTKLD